MFYRALTMAEATEFRNWARRNYKPADAIKGCWHPVVQDECVQMNRERAEFVAGPVQDA